MSATGGSIESVTLDGRNFPVAADADSNRRMGGSTNEMQANGDGSVRMIKTRMPWQASDLSLAINDLRGDHKFLQDLADRNTLFPITATYASGAIFNGSGQVEGEVNVSSQSTTAALSLAGEGQFLPQ